jgi:tetrahydromethanopterin S-methyltransferase subunit H
MWENAWWASDAEVRDDRPYLSRSALKDKLAADGNAERTVRNMINPSYNDKLIGALIQSGMIEATEHGWTMVDETQASSMMMRKNAET